MIIVNWKAYDIRKYNFFSLIEDIKKLRENYNYEVLLAVPHPFLYLSSSYKFLLAQDVSYKEGAYTGEVNISMLKEFSKLRGSLLNHSEKEKNFNDLINTLKGLRDNGFMTIVCVNNFESALAINVISNEKNYVDYIAYEPPELIGTNTSVSRANPEVILKMSESIDKLLVGAGIKDKEDFKKAIELGAKGVLVASGIVKNKEAYKLLESWITNI